MKRVGILGGMTFESTVHYYYRINRQVNQSLGGLHCAEMVLYNVDFDFINTHMQVEDWEPIFDKLLEASLIIEKAGADFLLIATNTMHRFYDRLQANLNIPILHIADCIAENCKKQEMEKVLLLGTVFTMKQDFLKKRLAQHNITVIVPDEEKDQKEIHRIIIEELAFGRILDSSRESYVRIINNLITKESIQAVVLGCTEIEMLLRPEDISLPVIDSTQAHIDGAVKMIVKG